ncbi:hypothetical protein SAMD00079811_21930 [Scytonema sp. HK-05]|uniref:hypothetical protein n=1 Tax=Scytonema sp. HK-05 TaxID=1137095 RepID=UPI000B61AC2C|nr:hypothetical protein [Scytonema sp. HK-05]BAY44592.1 hypothetical protein SAMD00079811_21930 [Scytonema sp. HK-05]
MTRTGQHPPRVLLKHPQISVVAVVIAKNPAYTSQLLSYRDEVVFTDTSIREYWDANLKLWVDRDINAAINLKRVGLDVFPTIKRRKGGIVIVGSITDDTSKEVLRILRRKAPRFANGILEKPTPPAPGRCRSVTNLQTGNDYR